MKGRKWIALALSAALCIVPFQTGEKTGSLSIATVSAEDRNDMPSDYATACDWIWTNRIEREGSMKDWATIYDQIVAGNGTLQYILIWQSYEKITLEQRQKLPQMLEDAVNQWTDHLIGYDGWPFQHVNVKIVGYAVLDKSCLLDLQPDEVVYTDTTSSWLRDDMITSGMGDTSVPAIQPAEPTDLSRYSHWSDPNWSYHGSYSNRYDMYLHGITGMIHMGGYGYHYGQILSDQSVLGLIDGTTSQHILLHEMGHGFGFPDYYGGEGESDGFPPGGFPGGENSIMMAGSCSSINQFDQWFLKYAWSKLKAENGRFDLSAITIPRQQFQPLQQLLRPQLQIQPLLQQSRFRLQRLPHLQIRFQRLHRQKMVASFGLQTMEHFCFMVPTILAGMRKKIFCIMKLATKFKSDLPTNQTPPTFFT